MSYRLDGKVVFVTGASSGIGAALAVEAASRGAAVALTARRDSRLCELAEQIRSGGGRALAVRCDVTRDGDLEAAVSRVKEELGGIDIAIANAGISMAGPFAELSLEDYRRQLDTNVLGVLRTLTATLPEVGARRGCLAVVGSANGYVNVPGWSAYCMSKAAVRSLCACLRHELAEPGVSVTHVAPGFIESEFRRVGNDGRLHAEWQDPVPSLLQMPADRAARQILRGIVRRRAEVVVTVHARVAIYLERHAPWLVRGVLGASASLARSWSRRR